MGSWGPHPPPEPAQALAVACGEEEFAIAVWPRGLAMRFSNLSHPLRWPVRIEEESDAGMKGGLKGSLTFNPLAKLHPV